MIWGTENNYLLCSTQWVRPPSGKGCGNEPNVSMCGSVYSICSSQLFTDASIIPCLNKRDPLEEKNKKESINSLMPRNTGSNIYEEAVAYVRTSIKIWTEKRCQGDVYPLHLCHKPQKSVVCFWCCYRHYSLKQLEGMRMVWEKVTTMLWD